MVIVRSARSYFFKLTLYHKPFLKFDFPYNWLPLQCYLYTGSGRVRPASVWLEGNNTGVIIYSFNLNISPKMSYTVLECDLVTFQNYMLMIL